MTMHEPAMLLVTCCLEETRLALARQVIANMTACCPAWWRDEITVFDNASTLLHADELRASFKNVVRSDRNVGYWSAVDWWLNSLRDRAPRYTYIVESDMMHLAGLVEELGSCVSFLDSHPELGAMRLHEYSCTHPYLYDKNNPRPDSRRALWQSHINRVTGQPVEHRYIEGGFWRTNFLTQLPALNRYKTMLTCFDRLSELMTFAEPDFQAMYHESYPEIAIKDGGIFNCNLNPHGSGGLSGSWSEPQTLARFGYHGTRFASIIPRGQYTVQPVT